MRLYEHMLEVFRLFFQLRLGFEHQYYLRRLLPVAVSNMSTYEYNLLVLLVLLVLLYLYSRTIRPLLGRRELRRQALTLLMLT